MYMDLFMPEIKMDWIGLDYTVRS